MTRAPNRPAPGRIIFDPKALPIRDGASAHPEALPCGTGRRALCVGHVMPYPPRAGNEYRIHRLLRWLAQQGWDLTVVLYPIPAVSERQIAEAAAIYPNLIVCTRDGILWHRLAKGGPRLEGLRGQAPPDIAALLNEQDGNDAAARILGLQRSFCPDVLVEVLRHLDTTWRPDLLLAEYIFMTRSFPLLRPELLKVVDTIDVFSSKASKVERYGVTDGLAMSEEEEGALLRRADVLIGIEPGEAADLSRLSPGSEVVSVGVDFAVPRGASCPLANPTAVLVASDNPMNVKGTNDFLRLAWPLVRAGVPDAELRVIGPIGEAIRQPAEGVRILGRLERLDAEYAAARVAINPAIAGTGLKIKTVEALCHLRPVVTWPAGINGIGPEAKPFCHVATGWPDFARHLIRLLADTTAVSEMRNHRDALAQAAAPDTVYAPLRRVFERKSVAPRG